SLGKIELSVSVITLFFLFNGLSMTQTMILESIFAISILIMEIPSGTFADKIGRKWSLALSSLSFSIGSFIFAIGSNFWIFIFAQILDAGSWALRSGADSAFIYDSLKEDKRSKDFVKIMGRGHAIWMGLLAVLAITSAFLPDLIGYRLIFFVTSAFFFIGFLIAATFKEPPIHRHLQEKNHLKHILKAAEFVIKNKVMKNYIAFFAILSSMGYLTYFLIQPYYEISTGLGLILGIAVTTYFMSCSLGHFLADKICKSFKENTLLLTIYIAGIIAFLGMFFVNPYFALFFIFLIGMVDSTVNLYTEHKIHETTSSHHRATVISLQSFIKNILYALLAPLIGYVTDLYEPKYGFLAMGIITLFYGLILLIQWNKRI
ncbi:MFS transporter, partial [Candidatus Woesearchaeota archaeon]|nr:MFS transporter [Candidatus Woesearchaeota archaeon]